MCRSFGRKITGIMNSKLDIVKILETRHPPSIPLGPSVFDWLIQIGCYLVLFVFCVRLLKNKRIVLFFLSMITLTRGILYISVWTLAFLIFRGCSGFEHFTLVRWLSSYASVVCFLSALLLSAVFLYCFREKRTLIEPIGSFCSLLCWLFLGFEFCACIGVFMKNEVSIGAIRGIFLQ